MGTKIHPSLGLWDRNFLLERVENCSHYSGWVEVQSLGGNADHNASAKRELRTAPCAPGAIPNRRKLTQLCQHPWVPP